MSFEAYRAATGEEGVFKEMILFFVVGILSVMYLYNLMVLIVYFNYCYFEMDVFKGFAGASRAWWFGGGTDLTSLYIFDEDVMYFY